METRGGWNKGLSSWNKGLTKETDSRVAKATEKSTITHRSQKARELTSQLSRQRWENPVLRENQSQNTKQQWNAGIHDDQFTPEVREKERQITKQHWDSGVFDGVFTTPEHRKLQSNVAKELWDTGKIYKEMYNTPEARRRNSEAQNRPETRLKRSESMKVVMGTPEARHRNSESAKRQLIHYGGRGGIEHIETEEYIGRRLQELGYSVTFEKFVTINHIRYAVDVYATKGSEVVIFEVGGCGVRKLSDLQSRYPVVLQVPKRGMLG
jgi:hypothetical protein